MVKVQLRFLVRDVGSISNLEGQHLKGTFPLKKKGALSENKKGIYFFIYCRFLGACAPSA